MSELAKKSREAMRAKAHRMAFGRQEKVDSTSVELPEPGDGSKKQFQRQRVETRAHGGKVEGKHAKKHAGKKPRGKKAEGGATDDFDPMWRTKTDRARRMASQGATPGVTKEDEQTSATPDEARRDFSSLAAYRRSLGRKSGGKVHSDEAEDKALIKREVKPSALKRAERKSGGRAKGKTNVNIVIAQPHAGAPAAMPGAGAMPHPVGPIPGGGAPMPGGAPIGVPPAGGMPGAAPAGMPPMPPGAGGPPGMMMPRKSGGRTIAMHAGSGSGEGRLEKVEIQKRADRR